MEIIKTNIPEVIEFRPKIFGDSRGYFFESFRQDIFEKAVSRINLIQDNESKSTYGVLRGLHYQKPPFAQGKLVRVISGKVLDIAIDIRRGSPTYRQHTSIILDADKRNQLWIPKGFAHGYIVLSDEAIFSYKVDQYYAPEYDAGIFWNDPTLQIDWMIPEIDIKLSEKDKLHPLFESSKVFIF